MSECTVRDIPRHYIGEIQADAVKIIWVHYGDPRDKFLLRVESLTSPGMPVMARWGSTVTPATFATAHAILRSLGVSYAQALLWTREFAWRVLEPIPLDRGFKASGKHFVQLMREAFSEWNEAGIFGA